MITALLHHWEHFVKTHRQARVGNRPAIHPDPSTVWKNRLQLVPIIEEWLKSFPSRDDALKILNANHILAAPVLSVDQALTSASIQ